MSSEDTLWSKKLPNLYETKDFKDKNPVVDLIFYLDFFQYKCFFRMESLYYSKNPINDKNLLGQSNQHPLLHEKCLKPNHQTDLDISK